MSAYSHKSALDELRAKRPGTGTKGTRPRPPRTIPAKHVCWLPQNKNNIAEKYDINFLQFRTLRATCSSTAALCSEHMKKAAECIHGDYPAQYRLDRVS